jgi:hypothetical protein
MPFKIFMMTPKFSLFFFVFVTLLCGCGSDENAPEANNSTKFLSKEAIPIKINSIGQNKSITDYIEKIDFVRLQTCDDCLLSQVNKIIIQGQTLYILDAQYSTLSAFNLNGQFITRIGEIGSGPGQFQTLKDFILTDSVLQLLCNDKKAILKFSNEGKYLTAERIKLFGHNFEYFDSKWYFFINQNNSDLSRDYNLIITDSTKNASIQRYFAYPSTLNAEISFSGFLRKNYEGLLYNSPLSDTVFQITKEGIYPKYAFSFGDYTLPQKAKRTLQDFMQNGLQYAYLGNGIYDNDSLLAFSYTSRGILSYGFYDKQSKNLLGKSSIKNDIFSILVNQPVALINNTFISTISPNHLLNATTKNPSLLLDLKKKWPSLYEIIPTLKEDDNAILAFYNIKPLKNDEGKE